MAEYGALDATTIAQIVLVVELVFAGMLIVGMFLARRGNIRWHARIQSIAVLGNVPVVATWMLPQYLTNVWPGIPSEIGEPFYLFPTLMLVAGAVVEALGVYVILVAGTNLIPERFRFREYKWWMRTLLCLWWGVLLLGLTTYYFWFLAPS
ncbi:MAG: DUF420 domain-containing protein [Thermoplasmata archaeon]|nr:DUF420 domain-containing protein [Thermoplasmata archaeon]